MEPNSDTQILTIIIIIFFISKVLFLAIQAKWHTMSLMGKQCQSYRNNS